MGPTPIRSSPSRRSGSSPARDELIADTRERHRRRLLGRERLLILPFGLAFLAVAVPLALLAPGGRHLDPALAAALVAALALASVVEFQTGAGYAVATQLVLVPMLFLLPLGSLPLLVGLAYVLARTPRYVRGELPVERVVGDLGDALYVLAPVGVLLAGHAGRASLGQWPLYLGALGAQIVLDTAITCLRAGLALGIGPQRMLGELVSVHMVDVLLSPIGLAAALAAREQPYAALLALPLLGLVAVFARDREVLVDRQLELNRAYRGTALLLGEVVEEDDEYTGRHSRGVGLLALRVADELRVDDRTRRDVELGALLHDVGKVAIPKEILHKPGALSAQEWEVMRGHTVEGQRLLEHVGGVLAGVGVVVRASHERWDGGGYPDGLAGEDIPLAARIISCCDAFSAMTTDRPYRGARPAAAALQELHACAGTQFDPAVVAAVAHVLNGAEVDADPRPAIREGTLERVAAELERALPVKGAARPPRRSPAWRAATSGLEEGVVVHDAAGAVHAHNPSAERLLDGAVERLAAGPEGGAPGLVGPDGRAVSADRTPWALALATRRPLARATLGVVGGDGEVTWVSVSSRPLRAFARARPHATVSSLVPLAPGEAPVPAVDPVTGLWPEQRFEEELDRQRLRCRRHGERALLLVAELPATARAAELRRAADVLRARLRATDVIARLDGRRLAALLVHADLDDAAGVPAALAQALLAREVQAHITVSDLEPAREGPGGPDRATAGERPPVPAGGVSGPR